MEVSIEAVLVDRNRGSLFALYKGLSFTWKKIIPLISFGTSELLENSNLSSVCDLHTFLVDH